MNLPNNNEDINDSMKDEISNNRIKDALNNNYQRASSSKEAFKNTQGNKNFYKNKQEENNKRLEAAKERQKEAKNKVNNRKKGVNENSTKDKLKSAKRGFSNRSLGGSKTKEEKAEDKKDKKELKDANNELKEAKQERKDIIRDKIKSKAYELTHPLEAAKEKLKRKIIGIAIVGFVIFFIVEFIIAVVMNFIDVALEGLDNAANGVANIHEKTDNFLNGFGFQNSEDAFYDELKKLNEEHGGELNVPLLISTIFYDDFHGSGDEGFDLSDDDGNGAVGLAIARNWIKEKVRESNYTIGEDGLAYSSNKIYRLRKLARKQFDNPVFGKGSNKIEHNVSVLEFLKLISSNLGESFYDYLVSCFDIVLDAFNPANTAESIYQWLYARDETFFTTDLGGSLENWTFELKDLLDAIFSPFFDIGGITTGLEDGCDHIVCVKYYTYGYSEEAYDEYLRKHYIKNMPEFKKYISSNNDSIKEKEIDNIIREIHLMAEEYEEIYGVKKKSTENYNNTTCTGNIKESLLGDLEKPVSIPSGTTVSFTGKYAYGISGGTSHKGVDLNNTTAGVSEGADVYSVYSSGKVIESTFDKTYSDKNVNGGWLKIKYTNTSGNEAYDFTITYGGLDPNSITLKKDSVVNKGDVIGKIGSKDDSEDKDISSLHFGFYDNTSKTYQDPTNLFIPCEGFDGSDAKLFLMHNVNSISESNFIIAVESYCANNACNSEINAWSLSSVYRDSVSANLNPTFVVSRAFVEGFSPGGSSHNYWGVGCTNKCPSCCHRYNSIKEGIEDLASLRIISEYETLFDSLRSYAYIGDYWYPGSWSDGGCIYLPYMESHYVNKSRYNEVKNWCDSGTGSTHPTTDEDQDAYANFQCEKTLDIYKAIFKPE